VPAGGAWNITTKELVPTPLPRNCPIEHSMVFTSVVVTQPRPIEATYGALCAESPTTDVEPTRRTLFRVFVLLLVTITS
jgi:hypothetical protein